MKFWKTIANLACVILACIGVVVIGAFAYYSVFNKDITIGINNIDDQVALDIINKIENEKDLTQEQIDEYKNRYFMNFNYYDNSKKNGVELAELRFDYFTTYRLQSVDYRSTGMQAIGEYDGKTTIGADGSLNHLGFINPFGKNDRSITDPTTANSYVDPAFYYYDTTNGISWNGTNNGGSSIATELKRSTQFIIKIDNRPFSIQLTGSFVADVGDVKNLLGMKVGDKYQTFYYTYGEVFKTVLKAVSTNSCGYGDYYITVDLSSLFTVREYDADTGKFKTDNVTDIIRNYAVLKFHYEDNGAISSNQSMFGLIENNRKFAVGEGVDVDTTYWQERMVYNLSEKDLSLRYSEIYGGYFASLSLQSKKMFEEMPRRKVNIKLNLTGKNIVGFDYNAFDGFELDTVELLGTSQTFYLLEKSLFNTELKTLKRSSVITLDIGANAINNTYSEVII